ncbi:hypothetical protein Tco_1058171 [Tanacetum coccineum]|uniref:Uncharacterized protein n=1 Tax=Tanacetum coccineum TaxID=301880 RepID=A0ABQ5H7M9_9ASTR
MGTGERKPYGDLCPNAPRVLVTQTLLILRRGNGSNSPKGNGFSSVEQTRANFRRDCPKLKNKDGGNGNAQGWVYAVGNADQERNHASGNPMPMSSTGTNPY